MQKNSAPASEFELSDDLDNDLKKAFELYDAAEGENTSPAHLKAREALRQVLTKWSDKKYKIWLDVPLFASVLSQKYDTLALNSLKGSDAQKVSDLIPIAKELGFSVLLGNLTYILGGDPLYEYDEDDDEDDNDDDDDDGSPPRKIRRCDTDADADGNIPEFDSIDEKLYKISTLVDMIGSSPRPLASVLEFEIEEEAILPRQPFDDAKPDRVEHVPRETLVLEFNRPVIILFLAEDNDSIISSVGQGLESAFDSFVARPDKALAYAILAHMDANPGTTISSFLPFMEHAVNWKDVDLWHRCASCYAKAIAGGGSESGIGYVTEAALSGFGFDAIQSGVTVLVERVSEFREFIKILNGIESATGDKGKTQALMDKRIASLNVSIPLDTSMLVKAALDYGLGTLKVIIPKIPGSYGYRCLSSLATALYQSRAQFSSQANTGVKVEEPAAVDPAVAAVIQQCLEASSPVYDHGKHSTPAQFNNAYRPVSIFLTKTLRQFGIRRSTEPFASFYRQLISQYLARVLGSSAPEVHDNITIGCNKCLDCRALHAWVNDAGANAPHRISVHQTQLAHLEGFLNWKRIKKLLQYTTEQPSTLVVTKREALIKLFTAASWETKKVAALDFLKMLGDDTELSEIMGSRWGDVQAAVEGTRAFVITPLPVVGPATSTAAQHGKLEPGEIARSAGTHDNSAARGTKRKHRQ